MELKARINDDLKTALRGGRRLEVDALRGLKSEILNEEIKSGCREEGLGEDKILAVVGRELKKRRESESLYHQADRSDLAEVEANQAEILERYLPKQLTESELLEVVDEVARENDFDAGLPPGRLIGLVKQKVGATASGAEVAKIVNQYLNQKG